MKQKHLFAVAAAMIAGAGLSYADDQTGALPLVAPTVKSLAAFKNGLAFVFKSADTPLKDGWARMDSGNASVKEGRATLQRSLPSPRRLGRSRALPLLAVTDAS
jgi:hypothetical protein